MAKDSCQKAEPVAGTAESSSRALHETVPAGNEKRSGPSEEATDAASPAKRQRTEQEHDDNSSPSAETAHQEEETGLSLLCAASLIQQTDCSKQQQQQPPPLQDSQSASASKEGETTPSTSAHSPNAGDTTVVPGKFDILCGRGGLINKHTGNIIYRRVVDYNKVAYRQVPKRHRQCVAQSIVQTILNRNGRFLMLHCDDDDDDDDDNDKNQSSSSKWKEIDFRRAVQKTSQALREKDVPTEQRTEAVPPPPSSSQPENNPPEQVATVPHPLEQQPAPSKPAATAAIPATKVPAPTSPPGSPVSTVTGVVTAV